MKQGNVSDNVFSVIADGYYNLTLSEKKAADFILSKKGDALNYSISEIASLSGVAEATITRFSRSLGYKGYNDFKIALAQSTAASGGETSSFLSGAVAETDGFSDIASKICSADTNAIIQTYNLLDEKTVKKAANLLENARVVYCMGQGGSMIIAEEAAHLFTTCYNKFFAVSDSHQQAITAAKAEKEDVILFFSYSGATKDMMDTLTNAKSRGAKSILVTHFPKSPGAELADVVLQCGFNESPLQLGSIGARISQLYLLDVLFSETCIRNLEQCRNVKILVADALVNKHI